VETTELQQELCYLAETHMRHSTATFSFGKLFAKWCLNSYVVGLVLVAAIGYAWLNRLVTDDAFITFQYSRNWVEGHGPVWNPVDAPVEGYSNFLWLIWMTIPFLLGCDAVLFAQISSLAFVVGAAWVLRQSARATAMSVPAANGLMMAFVLNFSLLRFATCGLETSSNVFLWVLILRALLWISATTNVKRTQLLMLSFVCLLVQMSRPDGLLIVLPTVGFALYFLRRQSSLNLQNVICLLLPMLSILTFWLIWKINFYGEVLPNTFHAKALHTVPRHGIWYLFLYFFSYLMIPVFGIIALRVRFIWRERTWMDLHLVILLTIWSAYMIYLGGDYNEFRMMLSIWPFLVFAAFRWSKMAQIPWIRWSVAGLLIFGTCFHALSFGKWYSAGHLYTFDQVPTIQEENFIGYEETGRGLRMLFGSNRSILFGCKACGMIPFFSRYRFVDLHGLNDRFIAKESLSLEQKPGHQRWASFAYLRKRGVNLVPIVTREAPRIQAEFSQEPMRSELVQDLLLGGYDPQQDSLVRMVLLPVHPGFLTAALYITPSVAVDSVIDARGLEVVAMK
jgi:arabinofuranosyltransferase